MPTTTAGNGTTGLKLKQELRKMRFLSWFRVLTLPFLTLRLVVEYQAGCSALAGFINLEALDQNVLWLHTRRALTQADDLLKKFTEPLVETHWMIGTAFFSYKDAFEHYALVLDEIAGQGKLHLWAYDELREGDDLDDRDRRKEPEDFRSDWLTKYEMFNFFSQRVWKWIIEGKT